ncbi:MAG: FAD-dependent oxidoreductase [Gammaproteobacteria bacterium]|nr:FAD-dependent oxidoreductase [Gammaproteobacteria bacterium]MDH5691546.1 FAD-dependent oxidoreductase [Gammaproteobacteria bacterium]
MIEMEVYDILVIGGGINGAGLAQAAAAQGYRVKVLEEKALASGTSSRSSKLIHGGLRYLETGQFSLVHECLQERQYLLKNAPDLVQLKPFYIPVYPQTSRRPWQLRLGLTAYGLLTGLRKSARFRTIPRREWDKLGGLETGGLETVFQYWDAQTDDARLTESVMQSAVDLGADLSMPANFVSAKRTKLGWNAQFKIHRREYEIETRVIINAAGPWVNKVLDKFQSPVTKLAVDLVAGTHLVLPGDTGDGIFYVEAPQDGRAVFVMPWYKRLMVGTTERIYEGDPRKIKPIAAETQYLLDVLAHYFPKYRKASARKIVESFAGARVLPKSDSSAFNRPRDTLFHPDQSHKPSLITLYGGKLTAYRATAERALVLVKGTLPGRRRVADTRQIHLNPV